MWAPWVRDPMTRVLRAVLLSAALISAMVGPACARVEVVVTIKPVHALVAAVMHGIAEPRLLVKGPSSPHTYALLPSDSRALEEATILFRVSARLEPFTLKIVDSLPKTVQVVSLLNAPGLELLPARRGPTFDRDEHDKDKGASAGIDSHVWLDPANASIIVRYVAHVLSSSDPANAAVYKANAAALQARLETLAIELERKLKPATHRPYIVFHDAMQYFERRFALNAIGSISVSPEIPPSARRLIELRSKIRTGGAVCAFAEPRFSAALVSAVVENTGARVGTLDPEAINLAPGPELYFTLMRTLAEDLTHCLGDSA
jgi:zinc transport system substrate-binding protein